MSWSVLLGAGLGIGLYAVGSMIQSASGKKKKERKSKAIPHEPSAKSAKPVTQVGKVRQKANSLPVSEKFPSPPIPSKAKEETIPAKIAPSRKPRTKPRPMSATSKRKKVWFLIEAKSGAVRVCEAWRKTPKTIAGPFPTKAAAQKAKHAQERVA